MLNRDLILTSLDLPTESVEIPEWGGAVTVKAFSGFIRGKIDAFIQSHLDRDGKLTDTAGLKHFVFVHSVADESGELLFTEADIPALSNKSAKAIDRVFNTASRINGLGMTADSIEEKKTD